MRRHFASKSGNGASHHLDGNDLRGVFEQMEPAEVVAALWGATPHLRGQLLRKLPRRQSTAIAELVAATAHLTFEQVRTAQRQAISVMCRLSRGGQIAFDVPEDLVA